MLLFALGAHGYVAVEAFADSALLLFGLFRPGLHGVHPFKVGSFASA